MESSLQDIKEIKSKPMKIENTRRKFFMTVLFSHSKCKKKI